MDIRQIKAVLFDLDGTLIDSESIYRKMWPLAMKQMGYEMADEQYLALRSLGRSFATLKLQEWYGENFRYDEARRIRNELFQEYINRNGLAAKKGAATLLDYLKQQGIVTAIVTATDPKRAKMFLQMAGLDGYFAHIISASMVPVGKPEPDVYLHACRELQFLPSECIAVEDAPNGVLSAYRAGCKTIMVPDQSRPDAEIAGLLTACVESLDEICDLLT